MLVAEVAHLDFENNTEKTDMLVKGETGRPWSTLVPLVGRWLCWVLITLKSPYPFSDLTLAQAWVEAQASLYHQLMWPALSGLCGRKDWMAVWGLVAREDCHRFYLD